MNGKRGTNQTAYAGSDRKWREKVRETYAQKRDYDEKNNCRECPLKKDCIIRKNRKGVCEYATN